MNIPPLWQRIINRVATMVRTFPIRHFRQLDGWLSDNEALALFRLARALPAHSRIVEIGSWKGKSTYCLARGLRSGKVTAIDPFNAMGESGSAEIYAENSSGEDLHQSFLASMRRLGVSDQVEVLRGTSRDFVDLSGPITLLFLDGDHSIEGTTFDFENFSSKVGLGGYIALHDYDPKRLELGPTAVVNNLIAPSTAWECVGIYDRLWVGRRRTLS